jgi:hypothetical protein
MKSFCSIGFVLTLYPDQLFKFDPFDRIHNNMFVAEIARYSFYSFHDAVQVYHVMTLILKLYYNLTSFIAQSKGLQLDSFSLEHQT